MAHYKLSPGAHARLKGIREFSIENWGEEQANKYISGLRDQMRQLAKSPKMGTNMPDLHKLIYCFPYVSHVIYYTITDYGIAVATILHKSMLPELHLKELQLGRLK